MNEDLMLSRSELAALDLLIDTMATEKAAAAIADPTAFAEGLRPGITKVLARLREIGFRREPRVAVAAIGGRAAQDPMLQGSSDMPEPTLEQLVALRSLQRER